MFFRPKQSHVFKERSIMKNYYRVMLGQGSDRAQDCIAGNFIAVGYNIPQDLTSKLPEDRRAFNREFIPV